MNLTNIEWSDFTLNPIIGCKRNCLYCYAMKLHNKRHEAFKDGKMQNLPQYSKPFNEVQFLPDRMTLPKAKSGKVFVGSMCDMWAEWIPRDWIEYILLKCGQYKQYEFMFLTQNPKRYLEFIIPDNCSLGATITSKKHLDRLQALEWCKILINHKDIFLLIEPLLGDFTGVDFSKIDKLIVGAMTGKDSIKPTKEMIESIKHTDILYKKNIYDYL